VRREPAVLKKRVNRSKVWWSIEEILRSEHAEELRYFVAAKHPSSRAMGEVAIVRTR
jgi:hypothetical protein